MPIATNSKYPRLGIRSEVRSTFLDDVIQNVKADLNTLEQNQADIAVGTTNAETTAARPYHTDLKGRLDTIGKGQASFIEGFAVTAQSVPNMTVQVASGEGTIDGIEVEKTGTTNTATITAPSTNPRWDVVYIDNTNTIGVATGSESANPVYPTIAVTRKPLAVIYLTAATTTITNSIITDARSWGAYYHHDGQYKWKWKAQDAIDDLDNTIGGHIKLIGNFYENINLTGNNNTVLDGYEAKVYRISSTNSAIMSVNTAGNETTGNKIYGFRCFGNSKAGSLPLYEFDYTDEFVISDCTGDGNSSSSATGKDIEINNCDYWQFYSSDNLSRYLTTNTRYYFYNGGEILTSSENNSVISWIGQQGNELSIATITRPHIQALETDSIAFIDSTVESLRKYRFDGIDWSLVGSGLTISGIADPVLARMTSSRVAFIDSTLESLRAYDFDGSNWSLVGSGLSIAGIDDPSLAGMSSTRVAFAASTLNALRMYDFDGSTWSQVGNSLSTGFISNVRITKMTENRIAFVEGVSEELRMYEFDGTNWSLVGSGLFIDDGSEFEYALTSLSSNKVAVLQRGNKIRNYDFNGSTWVESGAGLAISGTETLPKFTALSSNRIAYIDATNDVLRTYYGIYENNIF